jgi:hypothetical protein
MTSSDISIATVRMSATPPTSTQTLGAELERYRLERRVRRMTVAIGVLRQRESENRREPRAPRRHLGKAIADFEGQIEMIKTRLRDLGMEGSSIEALAGAFRAARPRSTRSSAPPTSTSPSRT